MRNEPLASAAPAQDTSSLTERQQAVLACISDSVRTRGYPPSMREIGQSLQLTSVSSVAHHLLTLERKGFLCRDRHRPRAYALAPHVQQALTGRAGQAERTADVAEVPLLGPIAAGMPLLAEQNVQDVLAMSRAVVGHGELFALKVADQSMSDAGILGGDVVAVRRYRAAEPGDIVAALLAGGGVTVRKLHVAHDGVWLMPYNRDHSPIRLEDGGAVLGKVVAVLRSL
ncbi:transcriptional repressor LexA [Streptomyces yaizuensis]|uniref:LexA repressor n=1 Tax=Streptomyces yaizuensis TaxID=2989713 RepID=A0ABQ5P6Z4_9ACTN|nr:transcriptional repressor LexA [Streptomyces sp. YSPA8]GLF98258.1 transcriptional repressor LexA [Streptomyces sp. YSPA8]